jgi:hypothetical protein
MEFSSNGLLQHTESLASWGSLLETWCPSFPLELLTYCQAQTKFQAPRREAGAQHKPLSFVVWKTFGYV